MEKDKYDIKEDLAMRIFRTIYYRQIEDMRYIKFSNILVIQTVFQNF